MRARKLGQEGSSLIESRFFSLFQVAFSLPIAFSASLKFAVIEMKPATQVRYLSLNVELYRADGIAAIDGRLALALFGHSH